jgi:peptidoglycan/xylan/chitin deacetylase (PgdA/CDA1 family)
MYVTQSSFEQQIRYLRRNYTVLSLRELLDGWERRSLSADGRYCVLTFDDGWEDTYTRAFPILRQYRIPATIFLATAYIGTTRWFWTDRLSYLAWQASRVQVSPGQGREIKAAFSSLADALPTWTLRMFDGSREQFAGCLDVLIETLKALPEDRIDAFLDRLARPLEIRIPKRRVFLSWDEVSEMSRHGATFGSHSCTHPILTRLPLSTLDRELCDSYASLQARPIASIPVFCYPNGNHSETVRARVKDAGYVAAVSVDRGLEARQPLDLFAIRRLGIHQDVARTPALFSLHLSGLVSGRHR